MGLDELDLGPGAQAGSDVDVDAVLHVRGLPSTMDRDEILELFSAIDGGAVVQESKAKRATVLMSSKDLADEAIRVLDSTKVQDKSISISIAKGKKGDDQKKRKKRESKSKSLSVYVEGITEEAELPELVEAFSAIDADASIHATNTAAGFCLLRTSSTDLADQIAASLDGMELRGGPQIVAKRSRKPAGDQENATKNLSPDAESADFEVGAEIGEKEEASSKYTQHRVEVRNIPSDMRSAELNEMLEALGLAPRGIKLSRQTASAGDAPWQNKGYAFAYFATDHGMRQAVHLTNGSTVRGNQITVRANSPEHHTHIRPCFRPSSCTLIQLQPRPRHLTLCPKTGLSLDPASFQKGRKRSWCCRWAGRGKERVRVEQSRRCGRTRRREDEQQGGVQTRGLRMRARREGHQQDAGRGLWQGRERFQG